MSKRAYWFGVGGVALILPLAGVLHAGCQATCEQDTDCPSGTFCFIGPDQCATPVPLGFCTDISQECTHATVTVCGCDNKTYLNACVASQKGQSYAATGACIAASCMSNADCGESDEVCAFTGVGICAGEGVTGSCVTIPTKCDDNFSPVCGCDGKTYQNVCDMQRAHTSELSAGGCSCQYNSQCGSGQFCNFNPGGAANGSNCLASSPIGECTPMPTSCSPLEEPVCGCDGNTYPNGCVASMQGVNVAIAGACTSALLPDAGADGGDGG
jgi:Kazal-type serine protease inhibitor domain